MTAFYFLKQAGQNLALRVARLSVISAKLYLRKTEDEREPKRLAHEQPIDRAYCLGNKIPLSCFARRAAKSDVETC